jgi:hypothetical protein
MAGAAALPLLGCGRADTTAGPDGGTAPPWPVPGPAPGPAKLFHTRGVVLTPDDLTLDWPERAAQAGLNTIALHAPRAPLALLAPFLQTDEGKGFLARCRGAGLEVEYEVHAMSELLPRSLFDTRPELFRMDAGCTRNPDANLCVHNPDTLAIAGDNARIFARLMPPTSHRYYFWGDDGWDWCRCPCCAPFTDSEQALILENHLVEALRQDDPLARVAHLAYLNTLPAPASVRPADGVFLEFAPILRRYDIPFDTPSDPTQRSHLDALDANLRLFGARDAKALEYWLDDSLFSNWRDPHVKLPFHDDLFLADVATYRARGVHHITSFAVYLYANYVKTWGDPPIDAYGAGLAE